VLAVYDSMHMTLGDAILGVFPWRPCAQLDYNICRAPHAMLENSDSQKRERYYIVVFVSNRHTMPSVQCDK